MADTVISTDPHLTDPALLRENSEFKSYRTSRFEYPRLRIFYRQHAKAEQLPDSPGPLPLLVCVPGLGGSVAQFHPLLNSLVDLAPCLAIDHPGGGRSDFEPKAWEAYTSEALLELYETIIEDHRDKEKDQTVVLIGHSMGTALAAWLANTHVPHTTDLAAHVVGLIAICPVSGPRDEATTAWAARLMWIPGWIFDLWRAWDGMGGAGSPSVARFVGKDAETESKILQYRFNRQSRTAVFRRMLYGSLPNYRDGKPVSGIPGLDVWAGFDIPVFLIAGEDDHVTPPAEIEKIKKAMNEANPLPDVDLVEEHAEPAAAAAPVNVSARPEDHVPQKVDGLGDEDFQKRTSKIDKASQEIHQDPHEDPSTPLEAQPGVPSQPRHPRNVIQSIILPSPATHALLYMPRQVRAIAGLISDFMSTNITGRLDLGWQLQYLSREGKWDVKNLNKWKSVTPVSNAIGPSGAPIFRAMKTLREADDVHCPKAFVAQWSDLIKDVVDITKDQPVYDPRRLERAGIHYHKFPTVSKVPPQADEVEGFIKLIDAIRKRQRTRAVEEGWDEPQRCVVGVHCHYGFNRTGYFVVCYLVERCGFGVKEAVEAFAKGRPNGIRHSHFLDRLYVRYSVDAAGVTRLSGAAEG